MADKAALGISTPRAEASAADVEMSDAAGHAGHPAGDVGKHYGAFIPFASYTMPTEPTWRVKPQFVSWQLDHGRFQVQRLIGKGSYGSVAEGIDHLTGRRVAIKKINSVRLARTLQPAAHRRRREARCCSRAGPS